MSKKKKQKDSENKALYYIVLATAILELIKALVDLFN